jgi:putative transposase
MSYSLDLRKKVIDYVENGGNITKAAALFNIGKATIYRWLSREKLEATKVKHRQRKLDWKALSKDVQENPESRLRDRAEKFGVRPSAICYALKKMKVTRKKKELRYKERNREERMKYYRVLRELIKIYGSESLVFIDNSGFEILQTCFYARCTKKEESIGR